MQAQLRDVITEHLLTLTVIALHGHAYGATIPHIICSADGKQCGTLL